MAMCRTAWFLLHSSIFFTFSTASSTKNQFWQRWILQPKALASCWLSEISLGFVSLFNLNESLDPRVVITLMNLWILLTLKVPFTYTLQARYLVTNPVHLSTGFVIFILLLEFVGLYAFRASNGQKDAFRRNPNDPSVAHLKTLPTKRGTKLLISGWWGMCRHPNYTADWMMAWAWCLVCGFGTPLTYFYVAYFGTLLVHREMRDDAACAKKYGDDWKTYTSIVKYRLIPGIY